MLSHDIRVQHDKFVERHPNQHGAPMYYTKLYFLVYREFLSVPLWRKSAAMWQGANKRDWEKSLKRELLQKFCCQCLHLSVHDDLRGHFVNG